MCVQTLCRNMKKILVRHASYAKKKLKKLNKIIRRSLVCNDNTVSVLVMVIG